MFDAVLVANRGEIAIRVMRGCKELGVRAVGVYSEADRDAPHVRYADEARLIGPPPASESYLNIERILEAARATGVDAIHPGYGFLSENADFAEAVRDAGFTFIGPPPEAIRRMGDKLSARHAALAAEAPVVPGTQEPVTDPAEAEAFASDHGYPIAVKAAFGGGGRGMRVVRSGRDLSEALESATREAAAAFGRAEVYLERYLERPRHVEIQVLGDLDGTVIHLGERDCSLQRRNQKLIEEAPSPGLSPQVRAKMGAAAVRIAREVGYHNAGTCEFLLEDDGETFHFLEMNTRLQVEHPVTEFITGVDLVHAQLRIASGEGMRLTQEDIAFHGHAIEVRLNAEDPANRFSPAPGLITAFTAPQGPWTRLDAGIAAGWEVPRVYDSLLAKLVVWGEDRDDARLRMLRALDELTVEGVPTTAPFHRFALRHPMFVEGRHSTISVEQEWDLSSLQPQRAAEQADEEAPSRELTVEVNGRRLQVRLFGQLGAVPEGEARQAASRARRRMTTTGGGSLAGGEEVVAPMQGTLVKYAVSDGDTVVAGDLIAVIEAMKMENHVVAHRAGVASGLSFSPGDTIEAGAALARIEGPAEVAADAVEEADVTG